MIPLFPDQAELRLEMREELHPLFRGLTEGISEFTFANLYLFRQAHGYRICRLVDGSVLFSGADAGQPFFMLPFGLPDPEILSRLFATFFQMKCVSAPQAEILGKAGYRVSEDRDNFDYLYRRQDLAELGGRKLHKKRNLIKAFMSSYEYEGRPLLDEYKPDALRILDQWRAGRNEDGDYLAAREGLEKTEELQLCGGIYYVAGDPVAYSLGEELMGGRSFAIHFEKAVANYKGLWQFVNQAFAAILPELYETINREQDLGDEGLRQAKLSYHPVDFVRKYRVFLP
ncbi:MAG: DUF2156 domain-containing protein [Thermodesulfobacteriota bacterium]